MEKVGGYANKTSTSLGFEQAIERVTELLKEEEFGILTEIDVKKTLKEKINVDHKPYMILGACNPPFAHQALVAEELLGVLLPCNVVVWDDGDQRVVAAMEPMLMTQIIDNPEVTKVAEEVSARLRRVLERIEP